MSSINFLLSESARQPVPPQVPIILTLEKPLLKSAPETIERILILTNLVEVISETGIVENYVSAVYYVALAF